MFQHSLNGVVALLAILLCGQAQAAITLSSTRVIYEGDKKEASVTVRNVGSDEILIQSWLDGDRSGTPSGSIPFAITPPLVSRAVSSLAYSSSHSALPYVPS
ncbi:fimbria/pilus periplasmic chaperone [Pseudomonas sp. ML2-2023-3]|uniref:fimbrial biogenesis chaperone n=1 Tax=Pseudomonas sp. ML2-2023-3 TaxID=3122375 RepID=UPI0030CBA51B